MSLLHYARHFLMLVCLTAALAAADRWGFALGMTASLGMYAAVHAAAVAASLRTPQPAWKMPLFVVAAATLCMLSVTASVHAGSYIAALSGVARPALVLAMAAAVGAAGYAILIRQCFTAMLTLRTVALVTLGCVAASLAVLMSGLYRHGGVLWFAAAWWYAFSIGLWCSDRRTPRA